MKFSHNTAMVETLEDLNKRYAREREEEARQRRLREAAAHDLQQNPIEKLLAVISDMVNALLSSAGTSSDGDDEARPSLYQRFSHAAGASRDAIVSFARQFVGMREERGNRGEIVRLSNGYEGDPWCGGFANLVYDAINPNLFEQGDFLRARSFECHGKAHNAFHTARSGYTPKPGDTVIFSRGGGKGHVGIVSAVAADGTVTYISGNYDNQVAEASFNLNRPPSDLRGYTDVQALAANKGIQLDGSFDFSAPLGTPARQHRAGGVVLG